MLQLGVNEINRVCKNCGIIDGKCQKCPILLNRQQKNIKIKNYKRFYIGPSKNHDRSLPTAQYLRMIMQIFRHSPDGVMVTDSNNKILFVNPSFTKVTGFSKTEALGKYPNILHSGKQDKAFYQDMWGQLEKVGFWQGEIWNKRKNGEIYAESLTIQSIKVDQHEKIYIALFTDITKRKQFENQLKQKAYFDSLTNLPSRKLFREQFTNLLMNAKRNRQLIALLFIDIHQFKTVNDRYGYSTGDHILCTLAKRLENCISKNETCYRYGGDKFIVLLSDFYSLQEIMKVANKILQTIQQPLSSVDSKIKVSANIGISIYPNDGEVVETLLNKAYQAVVDTKKENSLSYKFFSINKNLIEQKFLEKDIMQAIKNNQFELFYQPQFNLYTNQLIGFEALIRWNHPNLGLIYPGDFIPLAEVTGLILPLGDWVIQAVCKQIKDWNQFGYSPFRVAINLSALQFRQSKFIEYISNSIKDHNISTNNLEVELTETMLMDDFKTNSRILDQLKELGIHLSIDDFGTGYSSLSYLSHFPLQTLKIDRSFVTDIVTNEKNATIVKTIIILAHSLGLKVIAEGIETNDQLEILKQYKCDIGQGYLLGKPKSPKQINFQSLMKEMKN